MNRDYLTLAETMETLGITTRGRLSQLVSTGQIKRISNGIYDRESVEAYKAKRGDKKGGPYPMPTNLLDITGQESGLVLHGLNTLGQSSGGVQIIICNWSSVEGMPRLSPIGTDILGLGEKLSFTREPDVADIGAELADYGSCVIFDANGDWPDELEGCSGALYEVYHEGERTYVIAPEGWN